MKSKRLLLIMLAAVFVHTAFGETFTIIALNTPTINIGGKNLKKNDKFDSRKKINWSSPKQAMKVMDSDNIPYMVSPAIFSRANKNNFVEYIAYIRPMSVRETRLLVSLDAHRKNFENTFLMFDEISVPVGWKVNETSYFRAEWDEDGVTKYCILPCEEKAVKLKRELFVDSPSDEAEVTLTINYIEEDYGAITRITDKMNVVVVTLTLK